jgi:hypothetical protein
MKIITKQLIVISLLILYGTYTTATDVKNIDLYAVHTDVNKNTNGIGIKLNSQDLKLKLELSENFIKTGMVAKFNPQNSNFHIKTGVNLSNQKLFSGDNSHARVNQHSLAFATGYSFTDNIYIETGFSHTTLHGKNISNNYSIADETTKLGYFELAKRIKLKNSTIDVSLNAGKSFYEFKNDEKSYGIGIDYYPNTYTKLSILKQFENNNNYYTTGVKYKYWFIDYQKNTSQNTQKITAGLNFAFDTLFDFNTYSLTKPAQQKLPHLSELHRFEDVVLNSNMDIQSTKGIKKITQTSQPSIFIADQSIDDDGGLTDRPLLAPVVSNIKTGAIYEIVSDPSLGLNINANTGLMFWRGNEGGNQNFIITIKVTNPDGGFATTIFNLTVNDTL